MKCRRLVKVGSGVEAYYDITGGKGLADFATDDEAILQSVRCELHLQLGEWFLDTTRGLPLMRNPNMTSKPMIGVFPTDLPYVEANIKAAVLRVEGVAGLASFTTEFNHATRAATCTITGKLVSGTKFNLTESLFP